MKFIFLSTFVCILASAFVGDPIIDSWRKLEETRESKFKLPNKLKPPATEKEIKDLEQHVGFKLSEQVRKSVLLHNGMESDYGIEIVENDNIGQYYRWLSVEEIRKQWDSDRQRQKEAAAEGDKFLVHPKWVPIFVEPAERDDIIYVDSSNGTVLLFSWPSSNEIQEHRYSDLVSFLEVLEHHISSDLWFEWGNDTDSNIKKPVRQEIITPLRKTSFNNDGKCRERKQGGNPREVNGYFVFDGSQDGNRQVDPQIAVGGGYILHGTNNGLIIYDKEGKFIQGVSQRCFNNGIDPKIFFDAHNEVFGFDLWNPWDKEKKKPVNISVSESNDPTGAWNTYPVPAPGGVDGGGIGYSRKWIGYTFPGGPEQTFVLKTAEAKSGKPATVYHFAGNLGHPVQTQDATDELYFVKFGNKAIVVTKVYELEDGTPACQEVANRKHGLEYFGYPPTSPQKDSDQMTASGDRNPKNLVLQGGFIWFSQTINCEGRAAVQWHQMKIDGELVQTGLISDPKRSFIQTTIGVNKNLDVVVGFQETGTDMFISPRFAFRRSEDPQGTLGATVSFGEGKAATDGVAWGDYSGTVVDADNQIDIWTIQSVTDEEGKGDTVIAKIPFVKSD